MTAENENDALESAGLWYVQALAAIDAALNEIGVATHDLREAALVVASLARRGWMLEKEQSEHAAVSDSQCKTKRG